MDHAVPMAMLDAIALGKKQSPAATDPLSLLAVAAQAGDREATNQLLRAASNDLLRVTTRLLGDRQDGLDALQEAFLRICKALPGYDPRRPARPWLMQIAARAAQDRRRRLSSRKHLRSVSLEDAPPVANQPGRGPESLVAAAQLGASIAEALSVLPPRERDAFVLRELEQMPTGDVARLLGCSDVTVRGHCLQARRRLRAWLERHHPGLLEGEAR